jgi:hypothetical protein
VTGELEAFTLLLSVAAPAFTQPSFGIFSDLVAAWVLCPARHTITGLIRVADPEGRRAHDAYHRFFRAGAWASQHLWKALASVAVGTLAAGAEVLFLDVDDTLFHKSGRKVEGAGNFRDAIASTRRRTVYALGLNLVVLTLRVAPPWGGEPLGLPINMRLFRKGGPTHNELAAAMVEEVAGWFPTLRLVLSGDGAFASLAAAGLARTQVVSRMRRNAALYEAAPPRTGKRGRPRKKGERLPSLQALADKATWQRVEIECRGKKVTRLVYARPALWYRMWPDHLVLAVIVRDPNGVQADDYFFTTDLSATPSWVAEVYAGRWSIEDTFRNTKQFLRGEDPQCWKAKGPERAAGLSFWIYSAVWLWYVTTQGTKVSWPALPWYASKSTPSFLDALAALRRVLWRDKIFATSKPGMLSPKMTDALVDTLARAA